MKHELFKALARCRIIEGKMMEAYLNIPELVADEWVKEKLISRETKKEGFRLVNYYTLTSKGENYIKNHIPEIKELYRGFVLEHDLLLCEFYLKRNRKERDSWVTRDDLIKEFRLPGTVEGMFINQNGEKEAVKVLSQKADFSAVEKVERFLRAADIPKINYLIY